jgi:hypothetical protein
MAEHEHAGVPQRPESFGTRNVLTDAEFAARQAQAVRQVEQDNADFDFENPSVPFGARRTGVPTARRNRRHTRTSRFSSGASRAVSSAPSCRADTTTGIKFSRRRAT